MIYDNKHITQNSKFKHPPFFICSLISRYFSQSPPDVENNDMLNNDEIATSTSDVQHVPYLRIGDESGRFGETEEESRETNSFIIRFAPLDVQRVHVRGDVTMERLKAHQNMTGAEIQRLVDIEKERRQIEAGLEFGIEVRIPDHDLFFRNVDRDNRSTSSKRSFADIGVDIL